MTEYSALAIQASIAASVFLNEDGEVEFLQVVPAPISDIELDALAPRLGSQGFVWAGAAALIDGVPQFAFKSLPDGASLPGITAAFRRYCDSFNKGDEVEWLRRLWSLPDMRN